MILTWRTPTRPKSRRHSGPAMTPTPALWRCSTQTSRTRLLSISGRRWKIAIRYVRTRMVFGCTAKFLKALRSLRSLVTSNLLLALIYDIANMTTMGSVRNGSGRKSRTTLLWGHNLHCQQKIVADLLISLYTYVYGLAKLINPCTASPITFHTF